MTKRKFIGLGRKRKPETMKKEQWELPDNFILGYTDQHPEKFEQKSKKKVNSGE